MVERGTRSLEVEIGRVMQRTNRIGTQAAFRAAVEQRLKNLETEMGEVKSRLNGLLFFIASTVIAQVVLRIWA